MHRYWQFDVPSNLGLDSSGNANHGIPNTNYVSYSSEGIVNGAAKFVKGSNEGIVIPHSYSLDLSGSAITIAAWVYLDTGNNGDTIISKSDSNTNEPYAFWARFWKTNSGNSMAAFFANSDGVDDAYYAVPENQWVHVAMTYDGAIHGVIKFYVNGQIANILQSHSNGIISNTSNLHIGASPCPGPEDFSGLMDEVRIYNRALSDTEIQVLHTPGSFKLPDTGQTTCYDINGNVISCAGTGQDGEYNINPMSFTDNGDGTVTDNNTGLMWQKVNDGKFYNWYQVAGIYNATYNPTTRDVCDSLTLGGYSDWRAPTKKEMMSIIDYGMSPPDPTINPIFANVNSNFFWTATPDAFGGGWAVNFNYGNVGNSMLSSYLVLRCVRNRQTPVQEFTNNYDGTVTDNFTKLTWQQGEPGEMTWQAALNYCDTLILGEKADWRLPNIKEIESITDDSKYRPAIDTSFFADAVGSDSSSNYWSSTTSAMDSGYAWFVNFYRGYLHYSYDGHKTDYNYVRCVRGGIELPPPTYGNIEVSPTSHDFGEMTVGKCSPMPELFSLYNTGNANLEILGISTSDANFLIEMNDGTHPCGANNYITPGNSCTFSVIFCPSYNGSFNANISITSNDPNNSTVNLDIFGLGTSVIEKTKLGYIVVIDGMRLLSLIHPDCPDNFSHYLMDAINENDLMKYAIEKKVGKFIPFKWSRDSVDTGLYASALSKTLKMLEEKKAPDSPLVILSHSWGTFLAYVALTKNPDIIVDTFITLGSPLDSQSIDVKSYTWFQLTPYDIFSVGPLSNVKKWRNYWASCDPISGSISGLSKANKNIKIKPSLSYYDFPWPTCHGSYYKDPYEWQKILQEIFDARK
ncbi:MAG: DUF1566 domain-containing protein [bacterium]